MLQDSSSSSAERGVDWRSVFSGTERERLATGCAAIGLCLLVAIGALHWGAAALLFACMVAARLIFIRRTGQGAPGVKSRFARMLYGLAVVGLLCMLAPSTRDAALQLCILLVAFHFSHLSERHIRWASLAILLLITALALDPWNALGRSPRDQALQWMFAALFIPTLALVSREVQGLERRQARQQSDLALLAARLQSASERDALTGAANRRHMQSLLDAEFARQQRSGRTFSLAMIDVDHFKRINDFYGHAGGDRVLQRLVELAQQELGPANAIGRWGGEEFLVLLPDADAGTATARIDALRSKIAAHAWEEIVPGLRVSFSAGVCTVAAGCDTANVLDRADAALYLAKQQGRNRVVQA